MIALCTTCKGRTQHLSQTLPRNLAANTSKDAKFIVLDYNDQDGLLAYLKSNYEREIESGRLVVYSYRNADKFAMAHAKNLAHRCGMREGARILVNVDADNFTGQEFARYVARQYAETPRAFLWARMVKEGPGRLPRGVSGRIAVTSDAFVKVGGYDEQFRTWSPDDKDFNQRLRRLAVPAVEIPPQFLDAILHTDKMRVREWGQAAVEDNYASLVVETDSAVVNFGRIGCGTVYRNFSEEPIELGPLPTRIFGIGMHKTATTSLHEALKLLGYDSAHWKTAHWAKAIWNEMKTWGRSPTLEKSYALSDLPIPLLYRDLDRAYPGSKFVLTIRDEDQWLESVRNHWNPRSNPYRSQWDHDPFTHAVHKLVYGRRDFDEATFRARYRRHNREVKEYFAGRPGDLLIMDMDRGAGWAELAAFLGHPVPDLPYPRSLVTPKRDYVSISPRKEATVSLLKTIETIGQDILKGVEIAAPIIGEFDPALAPILADILQVITDLEGANKAVSSSQMSQIVQAMAMTGAVKQHTSAPK